MISGFAQAKTQQESTQKPFQHQCLCDLRGITRRLGIWHYFARVGVASSRETLNKGDDAPAKRSKSLIFRGPESPAGNYSDGVSRFRRSRLEGAVAVLHTDVG